VEGLKALYRNARLLEVLKGNKVELGYRAYRAEQERIKAEINIALQERLKQEARLKEEQELRL
jgi:hypothetical protein